MKLVSDLAALRDRLCENQVVDSVAQENLYNDLGDILAEISDLNLPQYKDLHDLVTDVNNRLQKMEALVETVAKEVGPIVAELAGSPIVKMLTGGKKRD